MQMQILVLLLVFTFLVNFLSCRSVNTIAIIIIIFSIGTTYKMSYLCNHWASSPPPPIALPFSSLSME